MKRDSAKILTIILSSLLFLSACKQNTVLTEQTVANESFGGIAFDPMIRTSKASVALSDTSEATGSYHHTTSTEAPESAPNEETSVSETTAAATAPSINTTTAAPTQTETTSRSAETTTARTTTERTTAPATSETERTTAITATTTTTPGLTEPETLSQPSVTTAAAWTGSYPKNSYQAINYQEMKGVWISYLEIATLLKGKNETDFRRAAAEIYDNCLSLGINTVFVHARAFGDAFYFSDLFPFTKHLSGSIGVKTAYDPYPILIDEAHKRGISFHAWINPLRLCGTSDLIAVSSEFPIKKWYSDSSLKGNYLVEVNGSWYLNPAYPEAIRLAGDGVREIVSRYDVDGVHIDDYFYPTTDASFDRAAYAASDASSLSAFRIGNCNELVREIYRAVHECSDSAVFGASTQGNMSNNLNQLYADAEAWCKGGYVDYFAPQIYYGFENSAQPFKRCTDEWNALVRGTSTRLCIGLAVYKIGAEDQWAGEGKYEWQNTDTMLRRQIEYAKEGKNYGGIALYSYNYLFTEGYRTAAIQKEIENFKPILTND
ncbi:MAG: family 10 glycosylhydrolase [Bacteroides sp.]|nr:family 10 glycosylhydrolase [Eubacterium sp.]MCM1418308.1 family 10 glycosylhydrolase [Roseburia sp.]MCM1462411.1 family 10 glycosylhydrolase [Bacteroides sp.]